MRAVTALATALATALNPALGVALGAALILVSTAVPGAGQDVVTITDVIDGGSGGLAVDADGNIYMGDFGPTLSGGGTRVFRSTPEGVVEVFATGFNGASGNDFNSEGDLFQSNINASRIDRIEPDGTVNLFTSSGIVGPVGIAIDEGDTLYVCNCGGNSIRKVTPDGVSTHFASSILFNCPNGITFDDGGNLYVANFGNGRVLKVAPDETVSLFATIPGNNNGHLTFHDGLLYVAARDANQIYTVTLSGDVMHFAGSGERGIVDGSLLEAQFSLPNDVIVDPTGSYMYVNDVVNPFGFSDTSPMILRRIDLSAAGSVGSPRETRPAALGFVPSVRPNPFRSATTIAFALERSMRVRVTIYDVLGRQVREVLDQELRAGEHEVRWTGDDGEGRLVAPGVYFYRLSAAAGSSTGRIHVVR